ncbi:hypothetical protein EDC04DRAFT_2654087, partial [Pisolithus marmoratus]
MRSAQKIQIHSRESIYGHVFGVKRTGQQRQSRRSWSRNGTAVAAPLHAELTEYTNLIRALRTNRTLDLTTHLLQYAAQQRQSEGSKRGRRERHCGLDGPLIDLPVPEWRLDDEFKADSTAEGHRNVDDLETDDLHPSTAHLLVARIGALLAHVLNVLADLRPATTANMQSRLSPLTWEDVISALAAHGVVDEAVISRANERLRTIYGGPSDTKTSAKAKYRALIA